VRLYLSSFRMGDHPEHLIALVGGDSRRTVVIANALDDAPPDVRRAGVELELAALADLGFDAVELDLRDYFAQQQRLRRELAGVSLAWLRGGNVFMLRYALHRSGGDVVLGELLAADALVYAGYSAGSCVLSPGLRGLELVDDADAVTRAYGSRPVRDGYATNVSPPPNERVSPGRWLPI
jgi:dipeptidase E